MADSGGLAFAFILVVPLTKAIIFNFCSRTRVTVMITVISILRKEPLQCHNFFLYVYLATI